MRYTVNPMRTKPRTGAERLYRRRLAKCMQQLRREIAADRRTAKLNSTKGA